MQRQSRCNDHEDAVLDIVYAGMDETYGPYVDDEWFDIHNYDDTGHDAGDERDDDTDDDSLREFV